MPEGSQQLEQFSMAQAEAEQATENLTDQATRADRHPVLSIVVPAFNESDNLPVLHERLVRVLHELGESYEIIVVDDGSTDSTWECIRRLAQEDEAVRGIRFSRNFGHQSALMAGLDFARGDAVITMDADLQHPPELIPVLVQKWRDGATVVNTVRTYPEGTGFFKKFSSSMFYWIMNKVSDTKLVPNAADFRLMDRKAVEALFALRERTIFLRGLSQWIGFSQVQVPFEAGDRYAGHTKYSFRKLLQLAIDGITSFSYLPLRIATWLGLGLLLLSGLYVIYLILSSFILGSSVSGWTWVVWVVLFATGIQFIILGVIGEYIARIYEETKGRPLYLVDEICGSGEEVDSGAATCLS